MFARSAVARMPGESATACAPFMIDRLERAAVSSTGLEIGFSRHIAEQGAPKAAVVIEPQRARAVD
jgi:hypothetical protein